MLDRVTVPSISVTTMRAEDGRRWMVAAVVTVVPALVVTRYTTGFLPNTKSSRESCDAVAVAVLCFGSGSPWSKRRPVTVTAIYIRSLLIKCSSGLVYKNLLLLTIPRSADQNLYWRWPAPFPWVGK